MGDLLGSPRVAPLFWVDLRVSFNTDAFVGYETPMDHWSLKTPNDQSYTTQLQQQNFVSIGFKILREPNLRKIELKLGNDVKEVIESMGNVTLVLDKLGFNFTLGDRKINLMLNSQIIVVENSTTKRFTIEEKSFMLWHKHLGHIFRKKVERLTKANFLNFDYLKNLQRAKKKGATRSLDLLEIIHTCHIIPTICVEKIIKILRFDHGGEYYGKYDVTRQHMRLFSLYLQRLWNSPQYTMLGSPKQNGVAKSRNRILKDIMRNMSNETEVLLTVTISLPLSVPIVSVPKIVPIEIKLKQKFWLRNLVIRLRIMESIARPLRIFCYNCVVVFYTNNHKASNGSKHLELTYLIVRVKDGSIVVEHIDKDSMLVDPLTKGLRPFVFQRRVEKHGHYEQRKT
ncbi:hypothetical protein CR513_51255, partial [Mucuna pruriens]